MAMSNNYAKISSSDNYTKIDSSGYSALRVVEVEE